MLGFYQGALCQFGLAGKSQVAAHEHPWGYWLTSQFRVTSDVRRNYFDRIRRATGLFIPECDEELPLDVHMHNGNL